jgi:hypothetical protein
MKAYWKGLVLAALIAVQLARAAGGAEMKLSLSYAGSLAADGVTPIGSALDPVTGMPAVNLPGSYHQYDVFMEISGLAADEDFQVLIFDVALGSGVSPADFGGWSANNVLTNVGPSSSYSVFGTNLDAGAHLNDLQRIVVVANGTAGVSALQPGESAPFRLGSTFVQWDGSTSDRGSLVGLEADTLHPWCVFQGSSFEGMPRSTLTIESQYDWTPYVPQPVVPDPVVPDPVVPNPVIETPPTLPTPQPEIPTQPTVDPDLRPQILPPAVEDPFDPPPAIPDPQPPIAEPDGPEPPQIQPPTFDPPHIFDPQPPVTDPVDPEPPIEPPTFDPSIVELPPGIIRVFPYPIGDPLWMPGEWLTYEQKLEWLRQNRHPDILIPTIIDGDIVAINDTPTDEELFQFALPVAFQNFGTLPQWTFRQTTNLLGYSGTSASFGSAQMGAPEPASALLASLALLAISSFTRRRAR